MVDAACDRCGKELSAGECRHVIRIEAYPAPPEQARPARRDRDADPLEAMDARLSELDADELADAPPATEERRFEVCAACRRALLRDPLRREAGPRPVFSAN